jgi:hypothetical protein
MPIRVDASDFGPSTTSTSSASSTIYVPQGVELNFQEYVHLVDGKTRFQVATALFKLLDENGGQILLSKVGSQLPEDAGDGLRALQTRLLSFVQEAPHGKYLSIEGAGGGQVLAIKHGPTSAISLEALRKEIIGLLQQEEAPVLVRSVGSSLSHGARVALKVNRLRLSKFLHMDSTFTIRNNRVTLAVKTVPVASEGSIPVQGIRPQHISEIETQKAVPIPQRAEAPFGQREISQNYADVEKNASAFSLPWTESCWSFHTPGRSAPPDRAPDLPLWWSELADENRLKEMQEVKSYALPHDAHRLITNAPDRHDVHRLITNAPDRRILYENERFGGGLGANLRVDQRLVKPWARPCF